MRKTFFALFSFFLFSPIAFADFSGTVIHIVDGDTITLLDDAKKQIKIRLDGIDCPEKGQAFANRAKDFTKKLIALKVVTIQTSGKDKHGRTIGEVILEDGQILSQELIKAGMAWWFFKYSDDEQLGILEVHAKIAKVGLWKDKYPIPPWIFRHRNKLLGLEPFSTTPSRQGQLKEDPLLEVKGEIRGNRNSKKYHRPDCPSYDKISPRNRIPFDSAQEARDSGYTLAGNCP